MESESETDIRGRGRDRDKADLDVAQPRIELCVHEQRTAQLLRTTEPKRFSVSVHEGLSGQPF